jgi:uncharacterized protein
LAAGAVSGVIGTGASAMLLPMLVLQFGPKQAIAVMAVASVMANIAKILSWRRAIAWRAVAAYALPGAPAAALGARTMLALPVRAIDTALGLFFWLTIPLGYWLRRRAFRIGVWQMALVGAAVGFLTGIVLSTGPLSVPAFLAFGLTKGAFLATEAMSSLLLMAAKVGTFRALGALPTAAAAQGLIVGASVMAGAFAGKRVVQHMDATTFRLVLDGVLFVSGLSLLWAAWG